MAWSISTNEEHYFGTWDTLEDAIAEGTSQHEAFWVGQCVQPVQPELLFDGNSVVDWLESAVYEHDDYAGEWAEGAVTPTREQCDDLAAAIRTLIGNWLDRHKLRPEFWNIDPKTVRKIDSSEVKT